MICYSILPHADNLWARILLFIGIGITTFQAGQLPTITLLLQHPDLPTPPTEEGLD
jgi:hypothetical protein